LIGVTEAEAREIYAIETGASDGDVVTLDAAGKPIKRDDQPQF
jgi:hypothetical protein